MYSILKTQKRSIKHKKNISITSSTFITNNHILLTFSDTICQILTINLPQQNHPNIIWQSKTQTIISQSSILSQGSCAIFSPHTLNIYIITLLINTTQGTQTVQMQQLPKGSFASMFNVINDRNQLNGLGCHFKLHTSPQSIILQTQIYKDRKLIFDCYNQKNKQSKKQTKTNNYQLITKQIDLQTNGKYAIDTIINKNIKMVIYKQQQIDDVEWSIKIYDPIGSNQNNHNQDTNKQINIILPNQYFNQNTIIRQVSQYVDGTYIVIVGNRNNPQLKAYQLAIIDQNMYGTLPNNSYHFLEIPPNKCEYLHSGFMNILYMNVKQDIIYVQCHVHERINGQLYQNCILIGNILTGTIIQKGYCTLKNINFSPNHRLILDIPYQYENFGETYYHIRLLLEKNNLYMFIIHNLENSHNFTDKFKQTVLSLF